MSTAAREINDHMAKYGFALVKNCGSGHMKFQHPRLKGHIITSRSPRRTDFIFKKITADIRRLYAANGMEFAS